MADPFQSGMGALNGYAELNNLAQWHNSSNEPTTTYPFQNWADTGNNLWKQRNAADNAWIIRGMLDSNYFGTVSLGKNKIINGNFGIWQRGTSFTNSATGNVYTFTADRWFFQVSGGSSASGTASLNVSRQTFTLGQTDVPNNPRYFSRFQPGTLPTQGGTRSFIRCLQPIEYVSTCAGKIVTVSFYAKADTNRTYHVNLRQSFGSGGSPSADVGNGDIISLTSSWQKFTITKTLASISGKTLGSDNNDQLALEIYLYKNDDAASANGTGAVGSWNNTQYLDIAQVQLEEGSVATNFEMRHIQQEIALCQRYYETGVCGLASGNEKASNSVVTLVSYAVEKRAIPTVTGVVSSATNVSADNAALWNSNTRSVGFYKYALADAVGMTQCIVTWTANAEL